MNLLEIIGAIIIVAACGGGGFFGAPFLAIIFLSRPISSLNVPDSSVVLVVIAPIIGAVLGLAGAFAILHAMGFPHG